MEEKQVHAQRKYAKGAAHIPPSNPGTPLETRVETGAQNSYKVLYNNNLLDIVSFNNKYWQPIVLVERLENTTTINAKREPPLQRASKSIENGARSHAKCETEKPPECSSVSPPSKMKSGIKLIKSPVLKNTVIFKKKIDAKAKIITTKPPVNETNEVDAVCPPTNDEQPLTEKKKPVPLALINRRKSFRRKSNDSEPTPSPETPRRSTEEENNAVTAEKKKPVPLALINRRKSFRRKSNDSEPTPSPETPRRSTEEENNAVTAEKKKPVPLALINRRKSFRRKSNDSASNSGLYYEANGIERWTSESTKDLRSKVPVVLQQKKKKIEKSPVTRASTTKTTSPPKNVCCSFIYLKDALNASQDADRVDAVQRSKEKSANHAPSEKKKKEVTFAKKIAEVINKPARKTRRSHSVKENIPQDKPARITKRSNSVRGNVSQDASTPESKKKKTDCNFPKGVDRAKLVDAPVFYPTEADFTDPISYFEKVMPLASQFGICKVVPPADFKPPCVLSNTNRFTVTNQYIPRLYTRWGPAFREMCAIRSYLASQKVNLTSAPLLEGLEVNLPKMYHTVQRLGGLKNVTEKKKWNRVAEEMHFYQLTNPSKKLEQIYVKYLLPYDTLTNRKRQTKIAEVEQMWQKKNKKILARAINPLHRKKRLLGDSSSDSDSDSEPEAGSDSNEEVISSSHDRDPLAEAEECIVTGRTMSLNNFEKVAQNAVKMYTPPNEEPNTETIENLYWKLVLCGADHVCVNSASVDTGEKGYYGVTRNKSNPYGNHPWSLKMISQNNGNVLRPLGPVLGLTVPTLHLGMIFSTSCWHRDPHGLPWIEYMHQGPEKIWYGIPDEQSNNFRKAVEVLCPTVCQNKGVWLSSDKTMIPPNMLLEHDVSLSKITQKPHEFVIVFPKAYSSSICTGYTISESVYFATQSWLTIMSSVFQELRESCEPTTFALEQLVMSVARDRRASLRVLQTAHAALAALVTAELAARSALRAIGLQVTVNNDTKGKRRPIRHQDECEICRSTLYLSKVKGVFGKQSALCVQHAMRVLVENKADLDDKRINKNNIELEIFFTKTELEEIEQNLQKRLLS